MTTTPRWRLAFTALTVLAVAMTASITATPAAAEVLHPRQQWLRDSTAGLFLHWGMFTAPAHLDCAQWEHDVTAGGWTPDYWVDEARKLGASYIVLATFHSRLGYARPWPSKIPGSCATQRDFLGELVRAGKVKGVRVLLYMTDDPQWHNEMGVETLDSAAYSAYKGQSVDLTTRDGFGMFSYDLFFEVMRNYPDLAGFWIDNDNAYWERNRLYEQIRELRPSWLLSNNNEDTPIMDTVSNEQKTGMTPAYDYPQAAFTPMPRLTEADYKLPTVGQWWYDGADHPVDYRLSTGRYVANAGSSMKSLMAETAMVNGRFPPGQEDFNNFMAQWLPPIRSTLAGTEGGGYLYGGLQPGFWNDGAHGVVTVEPGARTQYVHVLTRPSSDLVRLRDNGYRVTAVTDVRTGERMRFNQSGGRLTILGITGWDAYDTVFRVRTSGQQLRYDHSVLHASADTLVDGDFTTYWDNGGQLPVSVTLDLGRRRPLTYLAVNQREWSPTYARESFGRPEDSARIRDYKVYVSNDGVRWGAPVRSAAMASARGVQFIDLGQQRARYVKLEVLNTWAGPQAPTFYRQLKIDEIGVGYGYPSSGTAQLPGEAEARHNLRTGHARVDPCAACSGALRVTGLGGGPRSSVTFPDVTVAQAGDYRLRIEHTPATTASSLSVSVGGAPPIDVAVPAGNPGVPATASVAVPLAAGANAIRIFSNAAQAPALDRIAAGPLPPAGYVPATTMTVTPSGVQWVGPGQQSIDVSTTLRLDADDPVDHVTLAPVAPAGWTVDGPAAQAPAMRLGQTLTGTWRLTSPPGQDTAATRIPITASFQLLGRPAQVTRQLDVRLRPADRLFMREAEDSRNAIGSAGITSCSACSGSQKVRNIGGAPDAHVVFPDVTVPAPGDYTLYLDYTVNGDRSYFVSVNDGPPTEVKVSGAGNATVQTASLRVSLQAGANTIRVYNETDSAPDLDRISLGVR